MWFCFYQTKPGCVRELPKETGESAAHHSEGMRGSKGSKVPKETLRPEAEVACLPGLDQGVVLEAAIEK